MSNEIGTLVVVVLKARNLIDKHFFKQDVYTQVTLNGSMKQTKADIKGGQHPEWDEELRLSVPESSKKKARTLEVVCWSKEPRVDEIVGKGELDISETLKTGEFDDWIPLTMSDGTQRGEVYLEMTFYAAGPPPAISRRPSKLDATTRLSRVPQGSTHQASQHHHPGLQALLTPQSGSHLAPTPEAHPGRLTPRAQSPLPPLPEEAVPPAAAVPAILRPGTGRPTGRYSPQPPDARAQSSSTETSPRPSPRPSHQALASASLPTHHHPQSSLDATPEALRAGPGRAHTPTAVPRTSPHPAEHALPPLPAGTSVHGYVPVSSPEPILYQTSAYQTNPHQTSPYPTTPHHATPQQTTPHQATPHPITPYQATSYQNTPHQTSRTSPAPQPQTSIPALPATPHPHPAPAPTPSYSAPWQQHTRTPSLPQPPVQSSTYSVDAFSAGSSAYSTAPAPAPAPAAAPSFPSFSFPTPHVPAAAPAYTQPVNYPPYQASQPAFYPYRPAPTPVAQYARPYPYNYPPPREPDLDGPDVLNKERYQKPLPLPEEPEGARTPTPAHSHSHPTPRTDAPSNPPKHQRKPSRERSEDDRLVALAVEREEEVQKTRAAEQERRDRELARQLDMELNLAEMEEEERREAASGEQETVNPLQPADMPGSWYRHRVEV